MSKPVNKGTLKYADNLHLLKKYHLIIELDGLPYLEFSSAKQADFLVDLAKWKRANASSLDPERVAVRFFVVDPDGGIKEFTF